MFYWGDLKQSLVANLSISNDVIHVHVGLTVFLALLALLHRHHWGAWVAWISVLAIQLLNETLDFRDYVNWGVRINYAEMISDTANTMLWPTVFLVVWSRLRR